MPNGKTFIRITNQQIYDEILELKALLATTVSQNNKEHGGFKAQGKLNSWVGGAALATACTAIAWLFTHLNGG